jgi:hypothetical protein
MRGQADRDKFKLPHIFAFHVLLSCFSHREFADLQPSNPSQEEAEKWLNQYQIEASASWLDLPALHLKQGTS